MPQPTAIGPYVVLRTLGSGGMGTVYLCEHRTLGRRDAVKVPHPSLVGDALVRFQREAQVAAGFDHPHIATVYDAALDHDPPYLAMAYVEGQSLRGLLSEAGVLTVAHTARLLGPIASALDHCHGRGHTHRDVKPANILLGRRSGEEWPVLTDFGIVRADGASPLTGSGQVLGTAAYLSPEQVWGEVAGAASDLYALACVAFECVTGVAPFRGASDVEVALAHRDGVAPRASAFVSRVPSSVDEVLAGALVKDPGARRRAFPTVSAFVEALGAAAGGSSSRVHETLVLPRERVVLEPDRVAREPARPVVASPAGRGWMAAAAVFALVAGPAAFFVGDALVDRPAAEAGPIGGVDGDEVEEAAAEGVDAVLAPGAVLTAGQRELLAAGPLGQLSNCVPQPTVESPPTSAAVGCDASFEGVDSLLLRQSSPGAALVEHMDSPRRPAGDCATQVGVDSSWSGGPLACYDNTSGVAAVWWGYRELGVNVVAVREDGQNAPLLEWFRATDWTSPAGPGG